MSISDNKTIILQNARILFYEKGYNDTTFHDVAERSGITKALITYYFKTKLELAHSVRRIYTNELKNKIQLRAYLRFNLTDQYIVNAVELRASEEMYAKDYRANRFYIESPHYEIKAKDMKLEINRWEMFSRHNAGTNESYDEISLGAVAFRAAHYSLHINYYKGIFPCIYDQYIDYLITLRFRFMRLSGEKIEKIVSESKKIIALMDLTIKPNFTIE